MATCALCKSEKLLKESHIIPKFVFDRIKENSPTGLMSALNLLMIIIFRFFPFFFAFLYQNNHIQFDKYYTIQKVRCKVNFFISL